MSKTEILSVLSGNIATQSTTNPIAPIQGREAEMIPNRGGGHCFELDFKTHVLRVLILGTGEGYYTTGTQNTQEAVNSIDQYLTQGKGIEILELVKSIYNKSRAAKQDPTFMVLAKLCRSDNKELRKASWTFVSTLRTFSHLCTFLRFYEAAGTTKGWGRLMKNAFTEWIVQRSGKDLAHQCYKYLSREGWTLRDILRCLHLNPEKNEKVTPGIHMVVRSIVELGRDKTTTKDAFDHAISLGQSAGATEDEMEYLKAIAFMKKSTEEDPGLIFDICDNIYKHNLPREMLQTWMLKDNNIWNALLTNRERTKITMPMTALVRNFGGMTSRGVFNDSQLTQLVIDKLTDQAAIKYSKIHPAALAIAWFQYRAGRGDKGKLTWQPVQEITNALEKSIDLAFGNIEPTGLPILHCLDSSGSMYSSMNVLPCMTSAQAVALLALLYIKREPSGTQKTCVFSSDGTEVLRSNIGLTYCHLTPSMSLHETEKILQLSNWACTDLSLPIEKKLTEFREALAKLGQTDRNSYTRALAQEDTTRIKEFHQTLGIFVPQAFVIYTDNDLNAGKRHPSQALAEYRSVTGLPAKMVVVATTASKCTIADPKDTGMMDFVGFDSQLPQLLADFLRGDLYQ